MIDAELDAFKTSIDLRAYAASQGYALDRRESWAGSAVMRHVNGDKLIFKRDADGHYVYFSVRDDRDHGTIIDFIQKRLRLSLGEIRKTLRPWVGRQATALPYPPLTPTPKDRMKIEKAYGRMQDAAAHPYLESERAIPAALLQTDRFAGRIRIDVRQNAIFPHFDAQGLSGYEIKNSNFTGFSPGGTKGLWISRKQPGDNRLVICESAIDALSHAVLFPEERSRYGSFAGQISPAQREWIRATAARLPLKSTIVAATDADKEGGKLADLIREAVELIGRDDLAHVVHRPIGFKDWNDQLRNRPVRSSSSRPREPSVA
jgi:hypothetical protein